MSIGSILVAACEGLEKYAFSATILRLRQAIANGTATMAERAQYSRLAAEREGRVGPSVAKEKVMDIGPDRRRPGVEKTAGGAQSVWKALEFLTKKSTKLESALKVARTDVERAAIQSKLKLNQQMIGEKRALLESKHGPEALKKFDAGEDMTKIMRGTQAPEIEGVAKGMGTNKKYREASSEAYNVARGLEGPRSEVYTARKGRGKGRKGQLVYSDKQIREAQQGQRMNYAQSFQQPTTGYTRIPTGPETIQTRGFVSRGGEYRPPTILQQQPSPQAADLRARYSAPANYTAPTVITGNPLAAQQLNQQVVQHQQQVRHRVRGQRRPAGGPGGGGWWDNFRNDTMQRPGFWPGAAAGAAVGAGAVGLGAALGD